MRSSGRKLIGGLAFRPTSQPEIDIDDIYQARDISLTGDQRLILSILKEIEMSQQDEECLFIVMNSIVKLLPPIMLLRINSNNRLNSFALENQEVDKILADVQLSLEASNTEVCKLFLAEKFKILQNGCIYIFANSVAEDLKKYLNSGAGKEKEKSITTNGLIIQYILKSEGFKKIIKSLCLAMLKPSHELLKLTILLNAKDFGEEVKKGDFARTTLTKLSDEINKRANLPDEDINFLAAKLFEKHKYIYICNNFADVVAPLCDAVCSMPESVYDRKRQIEFILESFSNKFQSVEIRMIQSCHVRLSLGLLQWTEVDKVKCQLERDLFPKTKERALLLYTIQNSPPRRPVKSTTSLEAANSITETAVITQSNTNIIGATQSSSVAEDLQNLGRS